MNERNWELQTEQKERGKNGTSLTISLWMIYLSTLWQHCRLEQNKSTRYVMMKGKKKKKEALK